MGQQSVRQRARRAALDAQVRMRAQRAEQDKRRAALTVTVVQALAERDATLAGCERRAGEALTTLTDAEGLTLREAVALCGVVLSSTREASRLRRLAVQHDSGDGGGEVLARGGEVDAGVGVTAADGCEKTGRSAT